MLPHPTEQNVGLRLGLVALVVSWWKFGGAATLVGTLALVWFNKSLPNLPLRATYITPMASYLAIIGPTLLLGLLVYSVRRLFASKRSFDR